jgi:hypothetical protein
MQKFKIFFSAMCFVRNSNENLLKCVFESDNIDPFICHFSFSMCCTNAKCSRHLMPICVVHKFNAKKKTFQLTGFLLCLPLYYCMFSIISKNVYTIVKQMFRARRVKIELHFFAWNGFFYVCLFLNIFFCFSFAVEKK